MVTGDLPRVLVCDPIGDDALEILQQGARVDVRTGLDQDELIDLVVGYEALVVRDHTEVTDQVIESGSGLRVIGRVGLGIHNIDVDSASSHGVLVVHAPGAATTSVAELTFGLILTVLRKICVGNRTMKAGHWERGRLRGREIRGKTLGVIGYGRVGREVARLGQAFGAEVIVATDTPRLLEYGRRVELDRLYRESDIITLHAALTQRTRRMLDAAAFARMKDGVYLINTAHGLLVDDRALLDALNSGKVAAAGLDVVAAGPPAGVELIAHPHVVCTPHVGASTVEARRAVGVITARSVLAVLRGERPDTVVNPDAA